ncbi:amino acid ABC transporter permease [Calidifontibacter sp. DB0510]|uniref:Amino acid ABC transporter permease n=1 Tax=Metallococcus carri TaxID=1656884 RepID=A0A967B1P7_9MICO|nr:amino acid ABC transporter permease [Metallococcus carri]NHN57186.1 amino acid ABC transporter permease [Metallococcus carri]NOP38011.1 amino acid ABC transporter permease [Calidifontibacter sp. DB2511S]
MSPVAASLASAKTAESPDATTTRPIPSPEPRLVARRRPGRWAGVVAGLVLAAMVVNTLLTNPNFQWSIVGDYFLSDAILRGLVLTIWLTAAVLVSGYLLGVAVAAMRLSDNPVLSTVSFGFVWLVRSVPPLVQLLFWYEIASLYPRLSLGIPFGPEFVSFQTAHLFSAVAAAYVALSVDVAAFAAEIVRGGILAVPRGQVEAAESLGLSRFRVFRRVILPQAMPSIIPASGNLLIGMLKATSLVSVIAVQDLLGTTELIYNDNFKIIPLLLVATLWYLLLTTLLSIGQHFLERHFGRSTRVGTSSGWWRTWGAGLRIFPGRRDLEVTR